MRTGASGARELRFVHGPLFANLVLADEINRTPPKTQAALLEAMQERQVTAGGHRHKLPDPFFVLATQNPIEQEGTYPLPEAQLDRFLFKIFISYPTPEDEERKILPAHDRRRRPQEIDAILITGERIAVLAEDGPAGPGLGLSASTTRWTWSGPPAKARARRARSYIRRLGLLGRRVSRAGQALIVAAKAKRRAGGPAQRGDRGHPGSMARPVLRHRVVLNYNAQAAGETERLDHRQA